MSTTDLPTASSRSRLLIWFLTAVLLFAVALFVVLVMLPSYDKPVSAPAIGPSTPGQAPADTPEPSPAAEAGDQGAAAPSSAPTGVTWQLLGQAVVPTSAVAGPRRITATRASGFVQSPVGALVAAAQLSTRAGYSAGRPVWEPTLLEQGVPSPDRDKLLALLREAHAAGQPPAGPGELAQIAGFRFYSYTPAVATLGLVRRTPSGAYSITTLTVQWQGGDWKLVAPPGGHWPAVTTPLLDLSGVIAWGAS